MWTNHRKSRLLTASPQCLEMKIEIIMLTFLLEVLGGNEIFEKSVLTYLKHSPKN